MAIDFWVLFKKARESRTFCTCSEYGNGGKKERTVISRQYVAAHRLMGVFFFPEKKGSDYKQSKITVAGETLSSAKQAAQSKKECSRDSPFKKGESKVEKNKEEKRSTVI